MGVFILVIGGVLGAVSAFAAWLLGANLYWILGVYALTGHAFSAFMLFRYYRFEDAMDETLQWQIDREMEALRERMDQDAAAATQPGLFGLLRDNKATLRR